MNAHAVIEFTVSMVLFCIGGYVLGWVNGYAKGWKEREIKHTWQLMAAQNEIHRLHKALTKEIPYDHSTH